MKRYIYHDHPRDFANECSLVAATTEAEREALKDAGYEYLTQAEARRHLRWMNGENDSWGSNRAFGTYRLDDIYGYADMFGPLELTS